MVFIGLKASLHASGHSPEVQRETFSNVDISIVPKFAEELQAEKLRRKKVGMAFSNRGAFLAFSG